MNKNVIEPTAAEGVGTVNQEGDITITKVYTFRKLEASDVFPMFKILGKIGINEFADIFGKDAIRRMLADVAEEGGMKNVATQLGIPMVLEMGNVILGNMDKCEQDIYNMLANTSNLSVDEVKKLSIADFAEMVIDFIKKDEFKDFIKVVSRLFK